MEINPSLAAFYVEKYQYNSLLNQIFYYLLE